MNKIVSCCIYSIFTFFYSYITGFCSKIPPKAGTPQISFCEDAVFPNLIMGVSNFKKSNGIKNKKQK